MYVFTPTETDLYHNHKSTFIHFISIYTHMNAYTYIEPSGLPAGPPF